jgi:hypothetical protein
MHFKQPHALGQCGLQSSLKILLGHLSGVSQQSLHSWEKLVRGPQQSREVRALQEETLRNTLVDYTMTDSIEAL